MIRQADPLVSDLNPPFTFTALASLTPTAQDVFDHACRTLALMRRRCMSVVANACAYYVPKTEERCVVGAMLPDAHLYADFYKDVAYFGRDHEGTPSGRFALHHASLLTKLQNAHDADDCWDASGFIGWCEMERIAFDFGLVFNGKPDVGAPITTTTTTTTITQGDQP